MEYCDKYSSSTKIELICIDEDVEKYIRTILDSAQTGNKSNGKIFISDIEKAVSIRTNKEGIEAIK